MGTQTPADKNLTLITSDWHIGEHFPGGITVLLKVIQQLKPGRIILNGDILDACELHKAQLGRRAVKTPYRSELTIDQELGLVRSLLFCVRQSAPAAKIVFIEGNHEQRWNRVIVNNLPHLSDVVEDLPSLLTLSQMDIEWVRHGQGYQIDEWTILHGTRTSIHAGRLAMQEWLGSVIQGHSHRLKMYSQTDGHGRTIYGIECGHMHAKEAAYTLRNVPDWQSGFVMLTRTGKGWYPHIIPVIQPGVAVLPGRVIEVDAGEVKRFWDTITRLS